MEELFAILHLSQCDIISENTYYETLHRLFTENPDNDNLLYLEWEKDIFKAGKHLNDYFTENDIDRDKFGKVLMDSLREVYRQEKDKIKFIGKTYSLWQNLPDVLKYEEPFYFFNHADDPIYYNDVNQSIQICEEALNYYN